MTKIQLPVNWQRLQLEDVSLRFVSGGTPSTKKPDYWNGDIPWTTSASISENDTVVEKAQRFITQSGLDNSTSHIVPKRSLVVGSRVGVGKAAVNLLDIAISQDLTGIVLQEEIASPYFLAYQFKTNRIQNYFDGRKRGTTIKGVSRFDLEQLPLYLPPLDEQRAITAVLRTVQGAIAARRQEADLERERKVALMQRLFTHGTRGEKLKDTAVGRIPESWNTSTVGKNAILINSGATPKGGQKHYVAAGIPLIRSQNVLMNRLYLDEVAYIPEDTHQQMSRSQVLSGDVLLNITGASIGRVVHVPDIVHEANVSQHVCRIRLKTDKLLPAFLAIYLATPKAQAQIMGAQSGTTRQGLTFGQIKRLRIPHPPLDEQSLIAGIIEACNEKIVALEKESARLNELFQALLEELMSGRLTVTLDANWR